MTEVEEKFYIEHIMPILQNYRKDVLNQCIKEKQRLKQDILEALEALSLKVNALKGEEYKVAYIQFTPLQIGFLNETYEVMVTAYDEKWYGDTGVEVVFSMDYLFSELKTLKRSFLQAIKKYIGKIKPHSIECYMLDEIATYNNYLIYFVIQFLRQWDETESFIMLSKADKLKVTWGSYKDEAQTVFYYENQLPTEEAFKKLLQHEKSDVLVFTQWREIEMKNVQIIYKDLTAASFKKAHIEQSAMMQSWASGANFKEATLIDFKFKACDLKISDFTKSYLKNVCFEECNLDKVCFDETEFIGVTMIHNGTYREINRKEDFICS